MSLLGTSVNKPIMHLAAASSDSLATAKQQLKSLIWGMRCPSPMP
jgi:hypothetical protein